MHATLLGKNLQELQGIAQEVGLPAYTGKQMAEWIYKKRVTDIAGMTNISQKGRAALAEKYIIGQHSPVCEACSADGTKKYLFAVGNSRFVEAVYIPDNDRHTLCVSTQAGCRMGCRFCMTGRLGFHGQLTTADILNQIFSIPEAAQLTNLVYMGMGEPFDNISAVMCSLNALTADWGCALSPRRITVSSVGLLPELKIFLEQSDCHLAISLHNPFPHERAELMPIEKKYPLAEILKLLRRYDFRHQRRVSFEYILFDGKNDTMRHAVELMKLLRNIPCRVNLIKFHSDGNSELQGSNPDRMEFFRDYLTKNGIMTTIRRSRGEDILAACGMLVARQEELTT